MNSNSQKVLDQFFQKFYSTRIEQVKQLEDNTKRLIDIPLLLFWFSVIDFYGGIYYVGKHNNTNFRKINQVKIFVLANGKTFKEFVADFFPYPENQCGQLIYNIFRSGIVHQFSPKSAGIVFDNCDFRLLLIKREDISNSKGEMAKEILYLNISRLEELVYESYLNFRNKIETDSMIQECENICKHLIKNDIFNDNIEITKQMNMLSQKLKNELFLFKVDKLT